MLSNHASRAGTAIFKRTAYSEAQAKIDTLDRSLAIIEFDMYDHVTNANENFLKLMKYSLDDILDKHHRIFLDDASVQSAAYAAFWATLKAGAYVTGAFARLDKDKRPVWLEATYNPILNASGRPVKIIKFAGDISAKKN